MPSSLIGSVSGGNASGPRGIGASTVHTPAFRLHSGQTSNGDISTGLTRLGSAAQQAADIRIPRILSDIDARRAEVRPGFGRLTDARVLAVDRARQRGLGGLRDRLSRRRIAGSSFANADLIRGEREFAEQEEQARAVSFLEELELSAQLLDQEFNVIETELSRELQELGIAAGFAQNFTSIVAQQRALEAEIAAQNARQRGGFFGTILGAGLRAGLGAVTGGASEGVASVAAPTSLNTFRGFQGF